MALMLVILQIEKISLKNCCSLLEVLAQAIPLHFLEHYIFKELNMLALLKSSRVGLTSSGSCAASDTQSYLFYLRKNFTCCFSLDL